MAVGDLESKIGELTGQLRMLVPTLGDVGKKLDKTREELVAVQEGQKDFRSEIDGIKKRLDGGTKRWWDLALAFLSAVMGSVVTYYATKGHP